jgi:ureidoacrylate peracid hydrolase
MSRLPFLFGLGVATVTLVMGDSAAKKDVRKIVENNYLGSSGELAEGTAVQYKASPITWEPGMAGHSHYEFNPKKTALFIIDPQKVYSACPAELKPDDMLKAPSAKDFDGHSPLCCEKFASVMENANRLAKQARKVKTEVFWHGHVYREDDYDPAGGGTAGDCGRLCDFDVLGWAKWPFAFNLWSSKFPWFEFDDAAEVKPTDFYAEKQTYSAMTKPVVEKLKEKGIDTIIVTGFMTQFCSVTTSRHAHDLGFKVIYVTDGNDGPALLEALSKVDENAFIPFTLGVAVADTMKTSDVLEWMGKNADDDDVKEANRLYQLHWSAKSSPISSSTSSLPAYLVSAVSCFVFGVLAQRLIFNQKGSRPSAAQVERIPLNEE